MIEPYVGMTVEFFFEISDVGKNRGCPAIVSSVGNAGTVGLVVYQPGTAYPMPVDGIYHWNHPDARKSLQLGLDGVWDHTWLHKQMMPDDDDDTPRRRVKTPRRSTDAPLKRSAEDESINSIIENALE